MRTFFKLILILAFVAGVIGLWLAWPNSMSQSELNASLPAGFKADATKGETLYHIAGCGNCHMNEDPSKPLALIGGKGLETPFGVFYPPNITPDTKTGIGGWTDLKFINAVKRGTTPSGLAYYPAFPYTAYAKAKTEDLLHIKAYLDAQTPVDYASTKNQLNFPANLRLGVSPYKSLFLSFDTFEPDVSKSETWNRGAYLAEALGHCSFCHTPRTLWQTEDRNKAYHGAPALKEGEKAAKAIAGQDKFAVLDSLSSDGIDLFAIIDPKSSMAHVSRAFDNVPLEDKEAIAEYIASFAPAPR